jgi:hypothetical protein
MERVNLQDFGQLPQHQTYLPPPAHRVPPLVMSSSNVSTSTLDSELVSPNPSQEAQFLAINEHQTKTTLRRDSTSPSGTATSDDSLFAREAAALNVGSKRTASGTVKNASSTRGGRPVQQEDRQAKRHSAIEVGTLSVDLQSPANIVQLSADLRTRLKYAMLKVQNGWESQNIAQLEQLPVASPKRANTDSPIADWSRRESVSSTDAYLMSPFPNVRPHDTSRVLQQQLQFPSAPPHLAQHASYGPSPLAPPAQIVSQRRPGRRSFSSRFGPQIGRGRSGSSVSQGIQNQAEKDAVDSLLFMSSPVNATRPRGNTFGNAGSPSKSKRVEFDMSGAQRR